MVQSASVNAGNRVRREQWRPFQRKSSSDPAIRQTGLLISFPEIGRAYWIVKVSPSCLGGDKLSPIQKENSWPKSTLKRLSVRAQSWSRKGGFWRRETVPAIVTKAIRRELS